MILGWARPHGYGPFDLFHAVVSVDVAGSVVTACRGRWSARDGHDFLAADLEVDDNDRPIPKCPPCEKAAREGLTSVPMRPRVWWPAVADTDLGGESG